MKHSLTTLLLFLSLLSQATAQSLIFMRGDWKCMKEGKELYVYYQGPDVAEITVPERIKISESESVRVTIIGKNAFKDLSNLNKVTIPDNLKAICVSAFVNCPNLTKINLNDKVIVSERAFVGTPNHVTPPTPLYNQIVLRYIGPEGKTFDYPQSAQIPQENLSYIIVATLNPEMSIYSHTIRRTDCMDCSIKTISNKIDDRVIRDLSQSVGKPCYVTAELKDKKGNSEPSIPIEFTVIK